MGVRRSWKVRMVVSVKSEHTSRGGWEHAVAVHQHRSHQSGTVVRGSDGAVGAGNRYYCCHGRPEVRFSCPESRGKLVYISGSVNKRIFSSALGIECKDSYRHGNDAM